MDEPTIPQYLIHQITEGRGFSYRHAIKFQEDDAPYFIRYQYDLVKMMLSNDSCDYRILQQELVITRTHNVFDVLTVELKKLDYEPRITKVHYDITNVYGKNLSWVKLLA